MMWNRFGGGGGGCYGGHGGFIGIILFILFLVIAGGVLMFGVSHMRRHGHMMMMHGAGHDPLDIAKERYAKGEISAEEFETIKKNL